MKIPEWPSARVAGCVILLLFACSEASEKRPPGSPLEPAGGAAGVPGVPTASPGAGGVVIDLGDAGGSDASAGCRNLQCQRASCPGDTTTTVRGTVYAPNGTMPLYNALVYVPNAPLPSIPRGLGCDRCDAIPVGEPVAAALSDHRGAFVLEDVPAGRDIPLVIQVGKWRRETTIQQVSACEETVLRDPEQTRLPRHRGEGEMPRIAITTGACDNLTCLISKIGIDPSEWGVAGEDKVVTFFAGGVNPPDASTLAPYESRLQAMTRATTLWGDYAELEKYDMAVFSCECEEALDNKGPAAYEAVTRYLSSGGRVFGTDYQYVWYKYTPDANLRAAADIQGMAPEGSNPVLIDTSFPKGRALADWLSNLRPESAYGEVSCSNVFDNFTSASEPAVSVWGASATPTSAAVHPRFITMNVPVGVPVAEQCGRAVHLDAHITSIFTKPITVFPADCGTEFENGEEVLAFFFFDVAACIQDDNVPREPPQIIR